MKKIVTLFVCLGIIGFQSFAQDTELSVKKGDYKLLKLDALNLMGLGVQKLHLAYEVSPMKANDNNLPTVNFNLTIPFNSLNDIDMNYGIEGGAELRFYQKRRNKEVPIAEGFYLGVGLDGGYVSFSRTDEYYLPGNNAFKEIDNDYDRVRTGIYFLMGAQSKIGEKLYFDVNLGMGWSNVNVTQTSANLAGNYQKSSADNGLFYSLYNEGKGQRLYIPISVGLGYNFGTR
jgi:hypothetical protein